MSEPGMVARLGPVSFTEVRISDAFWSPRQQINRTVTIPFALAKCEETGRIDNFAKAGRLIGGEFRGIYYDDSDVFKVIEGASYTLASDPDAVLEAQLDSIIAKIVAAQEPDGYLYTNRTIDPANTQKAAGPQRWSNLQHSHELYNVGHLYEAAVAHCRATGKRSLLDVALKNAALILRTFGPDSRREPPGHQEIEIGLVRLYEITLNPRYLELAKFFLDQRGRTEQRASYGSYAQDHAPVSEQTEVVGHAVRALYMYSAMADIAALERDHPFLPALKALWHDLVDCKMAITGGVGARKSGESFGDAYELPNSTSYNETCAAIANVFWNHRLFLLSGDAKYLDVLERALYNGVLAGVSLSGDRFFYVNPLASDGVTPFNYGGEVTRAPWFKCSCCPVNVTRLLASLGGYVYATGDRTLYVNLFAAGTAEVQISGVGCVRISQETRYPWDGHIRLTLHPPDDDANFTLRIRVPSWGRGQPVRGDLYRYLDAPSSPPVLRVNGAPVSLELERGMAVIRRDWREGDTVKLELPMPVRRVVSHDKVEANVGRVALERGPLVYCVEAADNVEEVGRLLLPDSSEIRTEHRPELLGGVTVLHGESPAFTAIPYYAWSHRGPGVMNVWIERAGTRD